MLMRADLVLREFLKIRKEGVQLSVRRWVIQTLKIIRNVWGSGALGKSDPIVLAHHCDHSPFAFVIEKVIESNTKNKCDTHQRGQGGEEFSTLKFRKEGRRKPRVSPELNQSHAFLQTQCANLFADRIGLETCRDRFGDHEHTPFACQ